MEMVQQYAESEEGKEQAEAQDEAKGDNDEKEVKEEDGSDS